MRGDLRVNPPPGANPRASLGSQSATVVFSRASLAALAESASFLVPRWRPLVSGVILGRMVFPRRMERRYEFFVGVAHAQYSGNLAREGAWPRADHFASAAVTASSAHTKRPRRMGGGRRKDLWRPPKRWTSGELRERPSTEFFVSVAGAASAAKRHQREYSVFWRPLRARRV